MLGSFFYRVWPLTFLRKDVKSYKENVFFPKLNRRTGVKTNRATLVKTINRTQKAE